MHPRLETTAGTRELHWERISPPWGAQQLSTAGAQSPPLHPKTLSWCSQVGAQTVLQSQRMDFEPLPCCQREEIWKFSGVLLCQGHSFSKMQVAWG